MPAEWEPHERCWMQWPHRPDFIWPDLGKTQIAYANVAKAIRRFEPLTMMVCEEGLANARAHCGDDIDYLVLPLDDSWSRDSGPVFVKSGDELAASIFLFNAWGRKYERHSNDAAVGHRVAEALGIRTFSANAFLEGGAIAVDGEGTIITARTVHIERQPQPRHEQGRSRADTLRFPGRGKGHLDPGRPGRLRDGRAYRCTGLFHKARRGALCGGCGRIAGAAAKPARELEGIGEGDGRPGQKPRVDPARGSF